MNADDIELTSSEIAKAFQILRKYRYTFTTPERKPTFTHNEAESLSAAKGSNKRTLPYLDLADSCSSRSKQQAVTDWVDGVFHQNLLQAACPGQQDKVTELDIVEYSQCNPLYSKVSLLVRLNFPWRCHSDVVLPLGGLSCININNNQLNWN